jgi:ABC-type lipoprotein export system ATPase subunit
MGFMEADEGTISWQQEALTRGSKVLVAPASRRFSIVFQEYVLLPHLNVFDNVALGLVGCERSLRHKRVYELLALLHLTDRAGASVDELSGGEQQRVAIARALVMEPEILLADEPTGNLDTETGKRIEDILVNLNATKKITLVIVTHNKLLSERMSGKIGLRDGKIYDYN